MPDFAFFGTDDFAVQVLASLAARGVKPGLIVTTPDQPAGRGQALTPPPVKLWAEKNSLPFLQPTTLTDFAANQELFLVAAYGKILPPQVLARPKHGVLNIHPSLLPKYRGPSPIQTAILNGDAETGVSIMLLDQEMDHGPVLAAVSCQLSAISFAEARDKLAKLGAELFLEIAPKWLAGEIKATEQNHAAATYTKKFSKADAELKPGDPAELNYRKILALNPNPGTWLLDDDGTRLKILSAQLENGKLKFNLVIPAGKREMTWESYLRGKR
jgi:methionyl-tRNA formyltransferase